MFNIYPCLIYRGIFYSYYMNNLYKAKTENVEKLKEYLSKQSDSSSSEKIEKK